MFPLRLIGRMAGLTNQYITIKQNGVVFKRSLQHAKVPMGNVKPASADAYTGSRY